MPSSLAASRVSGHQIQLPLLVAPLAVGLQEHAAATAAEGLLDAQLWQAGTLDPGLPSSPAPVLHRLPCQMDRREAVSPRGHLPRQSGISGRTFWYMGK